MDPKDSNDPAPIDLSPDNGVNDAEPAGIPVFADSSDSDEDPQVEEQRKLNLALEKLIKQEKIILDRPYKFGPCDISKLVMPKYEFARDKIAMTKANYDRTLGVWSKLGQFAYSGYEANLENHTDEFYITYKRTNAGFYTFYIGQLSTDDKSRQGVGMKLCNNGELEEGYWLEGDQHGPGRCIFK